MTIYVKNPFNFSIGYGRELFMNNQFPYDLISSKLCDLGTTNFSVMSALAQEKMGNLSG
jgi:hypothetical protein